MKKLKGKPKFLRDDFDDAIKESKRNRLAELSETKNEQMLTRQFFKMQVLSPIQRKAIDLLADFTHEYTDAMVASMLGVHKNTMHNWRNYPLFIKELDEEITKRKNFGRLIAYRKLFKRIRLGDKDMIKFYLEMTGDKKQHIEVEDKRKEIDDLSDEDIDNEVLELEREFGSRISRDDLRGKTAAKKKKKVFKSLT